MLKKTLILMLGLISNFQLSFCNISEDMINGGLSGAACGMITYLLRTGPRKSLIATTLAGAFFNKKFLQVLNDRNTDSLKTYFKDNKKAIMVSMILAGISEHVVSNMLFFADKFGRKQKPSVVVYRKEKTKKSSDDDDDNE